jgi:hypothetical protein
MKTRKLMIAFVTAAALAWAGAGVIAAEADAAAYEQALQAAEEAQKKAASVGGEWRDVGKFLKESQAAANAGDYAKATKLANQAKTQSELGYEQAISQEGVGLSTYLK